MSVGRRGIVFSVMALSIMLLYQNCAPTQGTGLTDALGASSAVTLTTDLGDPWPEGEAPIDPIWEPDPGTIPGVEAELCRATFPAGANIATSFFQQARIIQIHGSVEMSTYTCPNVEAPYSAEFTPPAAKIGHAENPAYAEYIAKYNRFISNIQAVDAKFWQATGAGKNKIAECWVDRFDLWAQKGIFKVAPKARGASTNELDDRRLSFRADFIPTMLWQYARMKTVRAHLVGAGGRQVKVERIEAYLKDVAVANLQDFQNRYMEANGDVKNANQMNELSARIGMTSILGGSLFNHASLKSGGANLVEKTAGRIETDGLHGVLKTSGKNALLNHIRLAQALNFAVEVARLGGVTITATSKEGILRLNQLMTDSLANRTIFINRVEAAREGPTTEELLTTYRHSLAWAELRYSAIGGAIYGDLVKTIRSTGLVDRKMGGNITILFGVNACNVP